MPLVPVTHQSWLFSPPLELPLQPRLENGRFDSLRRRPLADPPSATRPRSSSPAILGTRRAATSISSTACIRPLTSPRRQGTASTRPTADIVKVEVQPGGDTANVSIDHHPRGLGFVTNYNHITDVRFAEATSSARASRSPRSRPRRTTRRCISSSGPSSIARILATTPPGDSDMVPIDPTRALYAWERRLVADEPLPARRVPLAVGVTRLNTLHFFFARFESDITLRVPMYEPMTDDERLIVELLRGAHRRSDAGAVLPPFVVLGVDVATQAELA